MSGEERTYDKSRWGPGEWQSEPDKLEWRHRGVPCLIVRSDTSGGLCGYAAVPPGHPWHGMGDDDFYRQNIDVPAHGGITFSGPCHGPICHVPQPGEPDDVHWLGFDCAHCDDYSPAIAALVGRPNPFPGTTYKNVAYVRAEVEQLADAILSAQEKP